MGIKINGIPVGGVKVIGEKDIPDIDDGSTVGILPACSYTSEFGETGTLVEDDRVIMIPREANAAAVTEDFYNWSRRPFGKGQQTRVVRLCYANGVYLAFTNIIRWPMYRSTDLVTWERVYLPNHDPDSNWFNWLVTSTPDMFLTAYYDTSISTYKLWKSVDGKTWTVAVEDTTTLNETYWNFFGLENQAYYNGRLILYPANGFGILPYWYTSDGVNWTHGDSNLNNNVLGGACKLICTNGILLMVSIASIKNSENGSDYVAYRGYKSTDGVTWTEITMPTFQGWDPKTEEIMDVVYYKGNYYCATTRALYYGSNLSAWTLLTKDYGSYAYQLVVFKDHLYLVFSDGNSYVNLTEKFGL